jgi:hypothetical protein
MLTDCLVTEIHPMNVENVGAPPCNLRASSTHYVQPRQLLDSKAEDKYWLE